MYGIEKRKKKYYINISLKDINGKRHHIHKSAGTNLQDAKKLLAKIQAEALTGYTGINNTTTEVFEEFLEYKKQTKKITTYNRYKEIYKKYIYTQIQGVKLLNINAVHINTILEYAKENNNISSSTLQAIYQLLHTFMQYCYKKRLILANPCDFVERPKRDKQQQNTLTAQETNTLLQHIKIKAQQENMYQLGNIITYVALMLTIETGVRRGELTALTWSDIDFTDSEIHINKNITYSNGHTVLTTPKTAKSKRTIKITPKMINVLKWYKKQQITLRLKAGSEYIIPKYGEEEREIIWRWEDGTAVHPEYFRKQLQKNLNELGLKKIRFHDLRHTNATLLYESGIDFKLIQERLGHTDISTTLNIYTNVTKQMQEKAVQALEKILQ